MVCRFILLLLLTLVPFGGALATARQSENKEKDVRSVQAGSADSTPEQAADIPGKAGSANKPFASNIDAEETAALSGPEKSSTGKARENKPPQAANNSSRGELLIAPIPISSPTIGTGLTWAVGYLFPINKTDKVSPPSVVGVGGLLTNNGSRGIGVAGKFYLKEDKYRITVAAGAATIDLDLYATGNRPEDPEVSLPIKVKGDAVFGEFLVQARKHLYIGPRFQFRDLHTSIDLKQANLPDIDINVPPAIKVIIDSIFDHLFRQRTVAIGPRVQWDSRDNPFTPTRGAFIDVGIDFFSKGLGSRYTYQSYKAAFNKYTQLKERHVFAFRVMGCAATGKKIPFYDTCLFGSSNDLRGYSAGRFLDRRMFATQAEYRLGMPGDGFLGRFGVVAFGGVGGVGRKFSDIGFSDLLPAGGGGLRFKLTRKNPINFRVDYGIGRAGGTLSLSIGEAF